ncbi:MAG: sigma-70 family RNA polymerase sigma factor [Clostridia bacterium]|nr:sigma-70 family RNA polymerase sigma factor [Clostridia bacterium]
MGSKRYSEYSALTNEELVQLTHKGDEYAFDVLARRFLNTRYSNSSAAYLDSDDFVQESMFGFLNAVRTYDAEKGVPFEAYAFVCMRNSINTAAGSVSADVTVDDSEEVFRGLESTDDPLKQIITTERLNEVLNACEVTLSEVEKTVVFFRAGGMSYAEIGEKLGMAPKSVDNAVQRARRKLKDVFSE